MGLHGGVGDSFRTDCNTKREELIVTPSSIDSSMRSCNHPACIFQTAVVWHCGTAKLAFHVLLFRHLGIAQLRGLSLRLFLHVALYLLQLSNQFALVSTLEQHAPGLGDILKLGVDDGLPSCGLDLAFFDPLAQVGDGLAGSVQVVKDDQTWMKERRSLVD